jgi:hypothetical protein
MTTYEMKQPEDTLSFRTESQLVQTALLLVGLKSTSTEIVTALEVDSGFGIADLVLGEPSARWLSYVDLRIIPPHWVYPLIDLPYRRQFSTDYFARRAHVGMETATRVLSLYVEAGFCERKSKTYWVKSYTPRPLFKRIVAIEAKLRDWRRALYQSSRYQLFANAVWVLLDEKHSKVAKANKDEFVLRNIGLATLNPQGALKATYVPRDATPSSPISYWRISAELLRRVKPL